MPEELPQLANSLTQVLGQSERVKEIVEECADDLSSVNAGLKHELMDGEISPVVENALEKSEAIEDKVQTASKELALVNLALKEEVQERTILEEKLAAEIKQGDEARHASLHDPLTGLPNRALFNDRLEHGLAHAKRNSHSLVVMFLDLDDFKSINDTHGHDVGDIVLTTIAERVKTKTPSAVMVGMNFYTCWQRLKTNGISRASWKKSSRWLNSHATSGFEKSASA